MKSVFIFLTLFILSTNFAAAEIKIGAGQEGRGYDAFASLIAERLDGATVVNYAGSAAISVSVCDGDDGIALTARSRCADHRLGVRGRRPRAKRDAH